MEMNHKKAIFRMNIISGFLAGGSRPRADILSLDFDMGECAFEHIQGEERNTPLQRG